MSAFFYTFLPILTTLLLKVKKFRTFEILFFFIAVFALFFLMGFRSEEVGIDTKAYYSAFYKIENAAVLFDIRYELGYLLLNVVSSLLGYGPEGVIAFSSLIIVISISYFSYKLSPSIGLSMLLYAGLFGYFFAFNGMRQAIAQSLILLGFALYTHNKKLLGVLAYILAPFFHFTSVVFFPILLLLLLRKKHLVFILPLAWLISIPFFASSYPFSLLSSFFFSFVPESYSMYTSGPSYEGGIGIFTLYKLFLFLFLYLSYLKIHEKTAVNILNIAMIGLILSNILNYSGFLSRLSNYWEGFLIVAIPLAIFLTYKNSHKTLVYLFFSITVSIFYFRAVFVSSNGVTPYTSWLF